MVAMSKIAVLNLTPEERATAYPCDEFLDSPRATLFRAIGVEASATTLFAWVCQLRAAPYSYDLLDNRGRRSPHEISPGLTDLALGQPFVIGEIVAFEPGVHVTARTNPARERIFGPVAVTYAIRPAKGGCRLVVKGLMSSGSSAARIRARLVSIGDLPMMRKQLLTLKAFAERDERRLAAARNVPVGRDHAVHAASTPAGSDAVYS